MGDLFFLLQGGRTKRDGESRRNTYRSREGRKEVERSVRKEAKRKIKNEGKTKRGDIERGSNT